MSPASLVSLASRRQRICWRTVLASFLTFVVTTQAEANQTTAHGSVTLVEPAGVGVAYDVQRQVLTAVFLTGGSGEPLSLLLNGIGPDRAAFGQLVRGASGDVIMLSSEEVSVNLTRFALERSRRARPGGPLMVLAQFN